MDSASPFRVRGGTDMGTWTGSTCTPLVSAMQGATLASLRRTLAMSPSHGSRAPGTCAVTSHAGTAIRW